MWAAMLAWPAIDGLKLFKQPGLQWWPFLCATGQMMLALWFPVMRATVATLFGPSMFAVALGSVATAQAVAGVVEGVGSTIGLGAWSL